MIRPGPKKGPTYRRQSEATAEIKANRSRGAGESRPSDVRPFEDRASFDEPNLLVRIRSAGPADTVTRAFRLQTQDHP